MQCKYCQNDIDKQAVVCPKCGRQLKALKAERASRVNSSIQEAVPSLNGFGNRTQSKNKTIAVLLCLFGATGLAGLHKLYEGKMLWGFIYMITNGFFMIGTAIDLFKLLKQEEIYKVV